MEKEIIASCQECEFEGVIEGDCCPECGSFIYADISYAEYCRMKESIRDLTDEIKSLKSGVKIPQGNLKVTKYDDPEYCGTDIYLEEEILVAVEYSEEHGLRIMCWGEMDDDPSHIVKVKDIEERLASWEE